MSLLILGKKIPISIPISNSNSFSCKNHNRRNRIGVVSVRPRPTTPPSLCKPSSSVSSPTATTLFSCSATAHTTTSSQAFSVAPNKSDIIRTMDRFTSSPRLMIVSDLDHTMVDHGNDDDASLLRFNALWEAYYRDNSLLVFSTGRSPTLYKELRKEKPMLTPDITIMSVGTEITYGNSMVPDDGWVEFLNQKWDRNIITEETNKFPELKLQSETEQRPHKVSFNVTKDKAQEITKALSTWFAERGLDVKIIYSGGVDLDILPQGAGKGQALAYLLKKLKAESKAPNNTLVCGDSGNDAELFSIPEVYGVMVSNAQEELLQWHAANAKDNCKIIHATERCAAGIIQAIGHFNLGPCVSPRDLRSIAEGLETSGLAVEVVILYLFLEKWRLAEIDKSELFLANLKLSCCPNGVVIYPNGNEEPFYDSIEFIRSSYGDKQGKEYKVWVDQILSKNVGSDLWLVKFKKWELYGNKEQSACIVTCLLRSKGVDAGEGYSWVHVHETWLDGLEPADHSSWII